MLGALSDSYEVAMYNAARPLAGGMLIDAVGVRVPLPPDDVPPRRRCEARADGPHLQDDDQKWIYVVTFPAFLTFAFFPADVLRVFFGPAYTDGAPALVILSVGFFVNALLGATARRCPRSA